MSGHSKWHSIKHKKGAADAKRGRVFTRIIKEMTVAARAGGGDPETNPRLRTIVADAKAANMPAENIKRAIRRGTGEEPGVSYEEVMYECYGPGGTAIILETLTDNKNRTVGEIRHILDKHSGKLGERNSVARLFHKRGQIIIEKAKADEETLMAVALDAGADDMQDDGDSWDIVTRPEAFEAVREAIRKVSIEPVTAAVAMVPDTYVKLDRQGSPVDDQADGRARGSRRHPARLGELRHRGEGHRGLAGVKVFGIDPGSERTGYGCVETDGSRHRLVACGAIATAPRAVVPGQAPDDSRPAGHAAGRVPAGLRWRSRTSSTRRTCGRPSSWATRAASPSSPRSRPAVPVVGVHAGRDQARGRRVRPGGEAPDPGDGPAAAAAATVPSPSDAADALAVAICHVHDQGSSDGGRRDQSRRGRRRSGGARSWRDYRPEGRDSRQ